MRRQSIFFCNFPSFHLLYLHSIFDWCRSQWHESIVKYKLAIIIRPDEVLFDDRHMKRMQIIFVIVGYNVSEALKARHVDDQYRSKSDERKSETDDESNNV